MSPGIVKFSAEMLILGFCKIEILHSQKITRFGAKIQIIQENLKLKKNLQNDSFLSAKIQIDNFEFSSKLIFFEPNSGFCNSVQYITLI